MAHLFRDLPARKPLVVLVRGDVRSPEPLVARVHSSCITSEAIGALDCDCAAQLDAALEAIARAGRGAVFYLVQEGRGAGFVVKARDRMLVQASGQRLTTFEAYERMGLDKDHRRYAEVGFARSLLGIEAPLRLLTSNPDKVAGLAADGIPIEGTMPLASRPSPYNLHYIDAKRSSGHTLPQGDGGAAELPENLEENAAVPLSSRSGVVRVASYQVPIAVGGAAPAWFRAHACFDLGDDHERVGLVHGGARGDAPLLRFQSERLLDRFVPAAQASWRASAAHIAREGAGTAVFLNEGRPIAEDDAAIAIARWLAGDRVRPLLVDGEAARPVRDALERRGFDVLPPIVVEP
jgi:GTP cyclohydrolase II